MALVVVLMALVYSLPAVLQKRPQGVHAWRQTDCLAFCYQYYYNGLRFFEPSIMQYGWNDFQTNHTVGESPLLYYVVAAIWKVTGIHEWIFRALVFSLFFWGLMALYRILMRIGVPFFWSVASTALLFTSPCLAYYSAAFLTDAAAMGLAFVATDLFIRYVDSAQKKHLVWSAVLFIIAGWLKITALILFGVIPVLLLAQLVGFKLTSSGKLFANPKVIWKYVLWTIASVVLWYHWANLYNAHHLAWFTSNSIMPLWELTDERIHNVTEQLLKTCIYTALNPISLWFHCAVLVGVLFAIRWLKHIEWIVLSAITGASAVYFICFYVAFDVHDYYFVNIMIFPLALVISLVLVLKRKKPNWLENKSVKIAYSIIVIYSSYFSAIHIKLRYNPPLPDENLVWIDDRKANHGMYCYTTWEWSKHYRACETVEPYLEQLGITRDKKIISLSDVSYNITLVLMNRTGWNENTMRDEEDLKLMILNGAEYIILNNEMPLEEYPFLSNYLTHQIGEYYNLKIYRIA
jgi:hypothetical protein